MKRSRWVSLLLACPAKPFLGVVVAATVGLFGQRADASRTPLTDVRAAITQPQQLTAPAADAEMLADAWLVESITPLGHTDDGQPLALISLLIPTAHLAEHTPASTRAGPYAAPKPSSPRLRSPRTHTRVFYIGQPPLGLAPVPTTPRLSSGWIPTICTIWDGIEQSIRARPCRSCSATRLLPISP